MSFLYKLVDEKEKKMALDGVLSLSHPIFEFKGSEGKFINFAHRIYEKYNSKGILKNGLVYDNLDQEEKEKYEDEFTDDDGNIPETIEGKYFYSTITNLDTIRKVLKDLMEEGIYVNNGDTLGKTIIFAKDKKHADLIVKEFRKMYPELCNPVANNGADYCVAIYNDIRYNEMLQREFKVGQKIRIVVSVDMMDTGVDVPDVDKVYSFIKDSIDDEPYKKIHEFNIISTNELEKIKEDLKSLDETEDKIDYSKMFVDENDILPYVRRTLGISQLSINAYVNQYKEKGYNSLQVNCIRNLLLFLSQNGTIEKGDLLNPDLDFDGIFDSKQINDVMDEIIKRI